MNCGRTCSSEESWMEEEFFDTRDEDLSLTASPSDSCPDSLVNHNLDYNVWTVEGLHHGKDRRRQLRRWMGLTSPSYASSSSSSSSCSSESIDVSIGAADIKRITSDSGAVSVGVDGCLSRFSSETSDTSNLEDGCSFQSGSSKSMAFDESQMILGDSLSLFASTSSPDIIQQQKKKKKNKKKKNGWLKRLGISTCFVAKKENIVHSVHNCSSSSSSKVCAGDMAKQKVKVHTYRKKTKEFSAVYMGQDFNAHKGAIMSMKFSLDGRFLASGGVDGMVRVWSVVSKTNCLTERDFHKEDLSCIYIIGDGKMKEPSSIGNSIKTKTSWGSFSKPADCVVMPSDVFQISEEPIHVFCGHEADVLDLSWSKQKFLLSSSCDKSVRLWHQGQDDCVKVFPHKDYVTCVQFNPSDERYFVSGSIDGKVRIWDTFGCQVVDWIDAKDIVSAVCYQPDGKGIVVGCFSGTCRFYSISGNHLQLDAQILLHRKKKFRSKRITGLEFSPTYPQNLMVTSADSHITILDKFDIVRKYKGFQNTGSRIFASFTSDGKHIVSASEDSNVYIWNHTEQNSHKERRRVERKWSSERFISRNISIAIPWTEEERCNCTLVMSDEKPFMDRTGNSKSCLQYKSDMHNDSYLQTPVSGGFMVNSGFFSEFMSRNCATWPEEQLLPYLVTSPPIFCRSHIKFLKTQCQSFAGTSPNAWGRVIVTAGYDGRIRSFCNYGLPVRI